MDTLLTVAIGLGTSTATLLVYGAWITVKYRKVVAFVKLSGLVLSGATKEVKPEEVLRQIIEMLEILGGSKEGRKVADTFAVTLIPKAEAEVKTGLKKWVAEPWDAQVKTET